MDAGEADTQIYKVDTHSGVPQIVGSLAHIVDAILQSVSLVKWRLLNFYYSEHKGRCSA